MAGAERNVDGFSRCCSKTLTALVHALARMRGARKRARRSPISPGARSAASGRPGPIGRNILRHGPAQHNNRARERAKGCDVWPRHQSTLHVMTTGRKPRPLDRTPSNAQQGGAHRPSSLKGAGQQATTTGALGRAGTHDRDPGQLKGMPQDSNLANKAARPDRANGGKTHQRTPQTRARPAATL